MEESKPIKIAFFDIDGTVSKRPLSERALKVLDFFRSYFSEIRDDYDSRLRQDMDYNRVEAAKRAYRVSNSDVDFSEYGVRLVNCLMSRLQRYSRCELQEVAQKAIDRAMFYDFSKELIEALRAEGYILIAISGSPQFLIDAFVEKFNFDKGIGRAYYQDPNDLKYKETGPETFHHKDKIAKEILAEMFPGKTLEDFKIVAVGDTAGDFEMLQMAEIAFAINPSRGLLERIAREWSLNSRLHSVEMAKNSTFVANFTDTHEVFVSKGSTIVSRETTILYRREDCTDFIFDILRKDEEDIVLERMIRLDNDEVRRSFDEQFIKISTNPE